MGSEEAHENESPDFRVDSEKHSAVGAEMSDPEPDGAASKRKPKSTIEERMAALMAKLEERRKNQRRLARPEDYVYDRSLDAYWDTVTMTVH
jgi:hypothetical protein